MGTPVAGRVTDLEIETEADSGTFTMCGGLKDVRLSMSFGALDVTDKDSNGFDEFIAGQTNATITGTLNYEEDDPGQVKMITMAMGKEKRKFRFRPWGVSAGADQYVWSGIITSLEIDSPNKDPLSTPFTIQLSGAPTTSDQ